MFTGIVEEAGRIEAATEAADGRRLRVAGGTVPASLSSGDSVSVSGACLTAERTGGEWFDAFLAEETVKRTYLGDLAPGDRVNLERAMPADGRFDGHLVQGHVDATGEVLAVESIGEDWWFEFSVPDSLAPYVVEKGSIAVDGISLTVAEHTDEGIGVAIVPTTYEVTTLSEKAPGDPVHLEADVIAKYVERITAPYR